MIGCVTLALLDVRTKNLPHSTDDVKRLCVSCKLCSELKPQFYRAETGTLIKATQPMERMSIDFKSPLKSTSRNTYMLTVIDEYPRFSFAFPCPNTLSSTVIKCLDQLFTLCGTPSYIHSDRGTSFFPRRSNSISHKKKESLPAKQYHITQSDMANVNGKTVSSGREFNYNRMIQVTQSLSSHASL